MKTNEREALSSVFCTVLERLAFMFGEQAEKDEIPRSSAGYLAASISFIGPMRGTLSLTAPAAMCAQLAANILGLDESSAEALEGGQDALKEVLNIVCGQLITSIAGDSPVFDLTVPQVSAVNPAGWNALLAEEQTAAFLVDDVPVVLKLVITEGAA